MTRRMQNALGGAGLVTAAAVALALWRCGGSAETAREPRAGADSNASERRASEGDGTSRPGDGRALVEPSGAVSARTDSTSPAAPSAAATPNPTSSGATPSAAASRINAALARDPKDLALFARIERELERSPPPAVDEIVALRGRGATRDALLAEARRLFADDFQLRALVVRWIDEVAPPPGGVAKPAPAGARSGSPVVQPIRAK
jgi:hypothetical protein